MAGSATLLMISLAQLFSLKNETTYQFCKEPNLLIPGAQNREAFYIESPGYPADYAASKDCTMKFKLPENAPNGTEERAYSLYLSCTDGYEMQAKPGGGSIGEGTCSDYLQVDEMQTCGSDLDAKRIHHIITGPIRKNGMVMRFKSDATTHAKGFRCHGIIDTKKTCAKNVFLTMPDHPSEVVEGLKLKKVDNAMIDCTIRITAEAGYHVKVNFLEMNLNPTDGDYCIAVGNKAENLYCSNAERGEMRWPPQSLVVEPHNGNVDVRLIAVDLGISRPINMDKRAFVIEAMLNRGAENAGSAAHLIFPDPNNPGGVGVGGGSAGPGGPNDAQDSSAPKPPDANRVFRQMMVPIPAPDDKDACMCWEFPPDNLFLSMMAMG